MSWPVPDKFPRLEPHQVHVWSVDLDVSPQALRPFVGILSSDERSRAGRYHFERDRLRFIVGRALLRGFLGRYLGVEHASLAFCYGDLGKPCLDLPEWRREMQFNLSHSGQEALFGFACRHEIGIDVELVRHGIDVMPLAERFFAADEREALRRLPLPDREIAFFRCWTRKEAYIKGRSQGLSMPLDSFSVSLLPDQPAALINHGDDSAEMTRWTMVDVSPRVNLIGALAVQGQDFTVHRWRSAVSTVLNLKS